MSLQKLKVHADGRLWHIAQVATSQEKIVRCKQFIALVNTTQSKLPHNSVRWLQQEELKVDYSHLEPLYIKHVASGKVFSTI